MRSFRSGKRPSLTFDDGLDVVKLLMTAYQSAEQGKTLRYTGRGLEEYMPGVATGTWRA